MWMVVPWYLLGMYHGGKIKVVDSQDPIESGHKCFFRTARQGTKKGCGVLLHRSVLFEARYPFCVVL